MGIPKNGDHPDFAECKAKSLGARRAIARLRLAFKHPIRLDQVVHVHGSWPTARRGNGHEAHEFIGGNLAAHEPDPCEAMIQKEEWAEERKYWLWRKWRSARAVV
jgi:hypothetical protein